MVSKYTGNPDVERARQQTIKEWLEEYTTGKKVIPGSLNKIANSAKIGRDASLTNSQYKYVGHRTLRRGGLILAFEDLVTYEEAICFFNVDIFGKHM